MKNQLPAVTVVTELITPAIAKEYLKKNTENRPLRKSHVEHLRKAFSRGEFVMTRSAIAFNVKDRLTNGQHRLHAVAKMDDTFSAPFLVARGLPEKSYLADDTGVTRT